MADVSAKEFAKYLNEKLAQFGISVTKLADDIAVDRRSIYRYKNAENPPKDYIEKDIRDYFYKLEQQKLIENGEKYISEHDLTEGEKEEIEYRLYEAQIDDEIDERISGIVDGQTELFQKIKLLSADAQKYAAENLDIAFSLNDGDIELLKKINGLKNDKYNDVVRYLENIPMTFSMLYSQYYADNDGPVFLQDGYLKLIRNYEDRPKCVWGKIRANGNGICIDEVQESLKNQLSDMLYAGFSIPDNIFDKVVALLEFTQDDLYLLFLYERLRAADYPECCFEIDGKNVGRNEYMFRTYLKTI